MSFVSVTCASTCMLCVCYLLTCSKTSKRQHMYAVCVLPAHLLKNQQAPAHVCCVCAPANNRRRVCICTTRTPPPNTPPPHPTAHHHNPRPRPKPLAADASESPDGSAVASAAARASWACVSAGAAPPVRVSSWRAARLGVPHSLPSFCALYVEPG